MPLTRALAGLGAAILATGGCHRAPPLDRAAETLNTTVAFAPGCGRAAYSSNRDGRFRPFVLDLSAGGAGKTTALELDAGEDFFVRSFSADCATLALVSDRGGRGTWDVFLYDLRSGRLRNLTGSDDADDGDPEFAPAGPLLAWLSAGELVLYDRDADRARPAGPAPAAFSALRWAPEGDRIWLEDVDGGIWEYALARDRFRSVWSLPRVGDSPRMASSRGDRLYFVSDHESDVAQIYRLRLRTGAVERVLPSTQDQFSPVELEDGTLLFRTSVDGSFVAAALRGGRVDTISPPRGVTYDVSLALGGAPVLVYAGDGAPASLYAYDPAARAAPRPLVALGPVAGRPAPRTWRSAEGMPHFLYLPRGAPRGWVVWLHGGPHEQVSPRFNPFFDALLERGYAVAALNYPGSTGIGNVYELRMVPERAWVDRQLAAVEGELSALRRTHPGFGRYAVVGVSYGAGLAQVLARRHPDQVTALVDFSGMVDERAGRHLDGAAADLPPALFIYGRNDAAQQAPTRQALMRGYASSGAVERLVLPDEGHYIRRRGSVARIVDELCDFLDRHAAADRE